MQWLTSVRAPLPPTPPPGVTVSQQPQTQTDLTGCRLCLESRLKFGLSCFVFWFSRYSLCMDPTENIIPLLIWVGWYHVFYCSGTVCLALDCVATLLPCSSPLLLHDVNGVVETMCLLSCCLATAVSAD
jgi:hypothetical protein